MKAMLDRLCRVVEWLCFGALIIVSYSLIAEITNSIIDANTPEQEMVVKKFKYYDWAEDMSIFEKYLAQEKGKALGEDVPVTVMGKPDMFQLDAPAIDGVVFALFVFLFLCYAVIYILNGKVRFLTWK